MSACVISGVHTRFHFTITLVPLEDLGSVVHPEIVH